VYADFSLFHAVLSAWAILIVGSPDLVLVRRFASFWYGPSLYAANWEGGS
jgi:hypothetical protein